MLTMGSSSSWLIILVLFQVLIVVLELNDNDDKIEGRLVLMMFKIRKKRIQHHGLDWEEY